MVLPSFFHQKRKEIQIVVLGMLFGVLFFGSLPLLGQRKLKSTDKSVFAKGLSTYIFAGAFSPNDHAANFYNGAPGNVNNISQILRSPVQLELIRTDFGVFDSTFRLDSWSEKMRFKATYTVGLGMRYLYDNDWGFSIQINYARLSAHGFIDFITDKHYLSLTPNRYRANVIGEEDRVHLELGMIKVYDLVENIGAYIEGGGLLSNARVRHNYIKVKERTYNLIDLYGGRPYAPGLIPYDIKQTYLAFGGWISTGLSFGFLSRMSIDAGVRLGCVNHSHVGYEKIGFDYTVYLRFLVSNLF